MLLTRLSTAVYAKRCPDVAQRSSTGNGAELVTDCKKCCVKDSGSQRYTKAELLVDQWRVR